MKEVDLTVSDLARKLRRSRDSVNALIQSGRLEAYDAAPDGKYRQYRVTPEALAAFQRANKPATKIQVDRRFKSTAVTKEFF